MEFVWSKIGLSWFPKFNSSLAVESKSSWSPQELSSVQHQEAGIWFSSGVCIPRHQLKYRGPGKSFDHLWYWWKAAWSFHPSVVVVESCWSSDLAVVWTVIFLFSTYLFVCVYSEIHGQSLYLWFTMGILWFTSGGTMVMVLVMWKKVGYWIERELWWMSVWQQCGRVYAYSLKILLVYTKELFTTSFFLQAPLCSWLIVQGQLFSGSPLLANMYYQFFNLYFLFKSPIWWAHKGIPWQMVVFLVQGQDIALYGSIFRHFSWYL